MKSSHTRILRLLLLLSFFIFAGIYVMHCATRSLDPDLGWHLRMGEEIVETKDVPTVETWNTPIFGEQWIDHEWLLNVGFFEIYHHFGFEGLAYTSVFLLLLLFGVQQYVLLKKKTSISALVTILILQTFGLFGMSAHIGIRPIMLSLLLFFAFLRCFKKAISGKHPVVFRIFLPLLFVFWANLHGSFLIGYAVLFAWMVIFGMLSLFPTLAQFLGRFFGIPHSSARTQLSILAVSFACLVAPILNPYGVDLYHLLSDYWSDGYYMTHITEWLPAWAWPIDFWKLFFSAFSLGFLLLWFLTIITNPLQKIPKPPLWETALFLLFLFLSLNHIRHFPLFFITALPLLFSFCVDFLPTQFSGKKTFSKTLTLGIPLMFSLVFLGTSAVQARGISLPENPFSSEKFCKRYPCKATEFLKYSEQNKATLLNPYVWGGYLLWVWQEKTIFIDGRQPQRSYEDHSFLEESNSFFDKEQIEEKLTKHHIEVVMLKKETPPSFSWFEKRFFGIGDEQEEEMKQSENVLLEFLKNSVDWKQVYEDDVAIIFEKEK